mmetsp:Transcript_18457/g.37779  ORF Transcript_18457/g.37779 Transcript_18457/m.37779 type:complete len:232 (-) Transcript_18457:243-938(-)
MQRVRDFFFFVRFRFFRQSSFFGGLFRHEFVHQIVVDGSLRRNVDSKKIGLSFLVQCRQIPDDVARRPRTVPITGADLVLLHTGGTHVVDGVMGHQDRRKVCEPRHQLDDKAVLPGPRDRGMRFPVPRLEVYPECVGKHHLCRAQHATPAGIGGYEIVRGKISSVRPPEQGSLVFLPVVVFVDRVVPSSQRIDERDFYPFGVPRQNRGVDGIVGGAVIAEMTFVVEIFVRL